MSKIKVLAAALVAGVVFSAAAGAGTRDICRAQCNGLPEVHYESAEDIPEAIAFILQQAEFMENALHSGLGIIRGAGGDKRYLTKEFIETQKQREERDRRRQALTSIVVFDANYDGYVTVDEITEGLRLERQSTGDETWMTRRRDELMRMDTDGDGRISMREAAENPVRRASTRAYGAQSNRLENLLALDIDGDGALSDVEMEAILRAAFAALDKNKDGRLTQEEKAVLRERQRLTQERAQMQERKLNCPAPKPVAGDDIAFLAARNLSALSSARVAKDGRNSYAAEVNISALDKKVYLVLASVQPTVWDMTGLTDRVSQVLVFGPRGTMNTVQAGLRGIARERVAFLAVEDCLPNLGHEMGRNEGQMARSAVALEVFLGRPAEISHAAPKLYSAVLRRSGFAVETSVPPEKLAKPLPGYDAEVWEDQIARVKADMRFIPAAQIVAGGPVTDEPLLPGGYGLAKLVHDGVIEKVPSGHYAGIVKTGDNSILLMDVGPSVRLLDGGAPVKRIPVYEYRLKRDLPSLNSIKLGLPKLLVPEGIKLPSDFGLPQCPGQKTADGDRVFSSFCR
ncbi:MAG: hypothetical protein RBS08_04000 [Bdellovibrionales bacterium]|jgi:Ca2+-binding EF-hand superfamily protein|nr:hypothetical protein [Bdellovibrionales bacterium]